MFTAQQVHATMEQSAYAMHLPDFVEILGATYDVAPLLVELCLHSP